MNREDIIATAKSMLGTPYHHQGRVPGVGLDCIGLVVCTVRALGAVIQDRTDYPRTAIPSEFVQAVAAQVPMKSVSARMPGDLLLIRPRKALQHAAILVDAQTIIHADHVSGVVLRGLSDWAAQIAYCFDLTAL